MVALLTGETAAGGAEGQREGADSAPAGAELAVEVRLTEAERWGRPIDLQRALRHICCGSSEADGAVDSESGDGSAAHVSTIETTLAGVGRWLRKGGAVGCAGEGATPAAAVAEAALSAVRELIRRIGYFPRSALEPAPSSAAGTGDAGTGKVAPAPVTDIHRAAESPSALAGPTASAGPAVTDGAPVLPTLLGRIECLTHLTRLLHGSGVLSPSPLLPPSASSSPALGVGFQTSPSSLATLAADAPSDPPLLAALGGLGDWARTAMAVGEVLCRDAAADLAGHITAALQHPSVGTDGAVMAPGAAVPPGTPPSSRTLSRCSAAVEGCCQRLASLLEEARRHEARLEGHAELLASYAERKQVREAP